MTEAAGMADGIHRRSVNDLLSDKIKKCLLSPALSSAAEEREKTLQSLRRFRLLALDTPPAAG